MRLKSALRGRLVNIASELEQSLSSVQGDLIALKKVDIKNALYVVRLRSLWEAEGEKSVEVKHRGNLPDVIDKAEKEYLSTNHRSNIQAEYGVRIGVGNGFYEVPKEFWEELIAKQRYS